MRTKPIFRPRFAAYPAAAFRPKLRQIRAAAIVSTVDFSTLSKQYVPLIMAALCRLKACEPFILSPFVVALNMHRTINNLVFICQYLFAKIIDNLLYMSWHSFC